MGIAALILSGFAIAGTTLVALTFTGTRDIIAENERLALLSNLNALVPPERYNNELEADFIRVIDPELLGTAEPVTVYRAYRGVQIDRWTKYGCQQSPWSPGRDVLRLRHRV